MKRFFTALFLICAAAGPLFGQEREQEQYRKASEGLSLLYRGRIPSVYPFRYNGTYLWDTQGYQEGAVMYNGKLYGHVFLNVDAYEMELLVKADKGMASVKVYRDQVAWFTMGERKFLNLRYLGFKDAPEGFFFLERDGENPLLVQVRKQFQSVTGNHNGDPIGYTDPDYDPDVISFFRQQKSYYTIRDGKVLKIRRRAFEKSLRSPAGEPLLASLKDRWNPSEAETGFWSEKPVAAGGIGLPADYFLEKPEDTTRVEYAEHILTTTYRNKVYEIGIPGAGKGFATVEGTVTEAETGEPLPGAVIYDSSTSTYVRTSAKGHYSIRLPVGENILNFSADSKEDIALRVIVHSDGHLNVVMTEKVTLLKASVVSATSMQNHRTAVMGVEQVSMRTMSKIPSAFGEGDILKAVMTLPGVKTVGEASGGFNVRGGSQDQNMILFNENIIYNPTHLFGIFSAFNPDIVDNVELYKSSIPAEFGGRISSVMTVKSKEGDLQKVKGSLGIGLLTSRFQLEGPLKKGKTTFVAGARTSYSDWLLKKLPKDSYYSGGSAGFTDANAGLTHRFDANNSLQVNGYFATDRFALTTDTTFRYRNINASLIFRHKGADGSSLKVSAGYDHFFNRVGIHDWEAAAYDLDTYIRDAFFRSAWTRPLENHSLSAGVDVVGYALDPGTMTPSGPSSYIVGRKLDREYAVEPAAFLSDNWSLTEQFSLEGGIRLSSYLFLAPSTFRFGPEFRLSARYSPADNVSLKAGFNTMRQYIHLISNTSALSPMDTWKLTDPAIDPTTGWQGAGGVYWTHLGTGVDFSLEGYYKRMKNCLDYLPGATLSMNPDLADDLVPVFGKAYGVEAMVKKQTGKLTGWVSYSYSRARYKEDSDRGLGAIANGNWYNAPYDKPHEFKLVGNYALTHRFSLSANLDYSTGRPVTVPLGKYYFAGAYRMAYSTRNSYRIPDYFRLDLALNIDPGHYLKAIAHTSVTLGVYNVTGRKNPYSVFFKSNSVGKTQGYMLSVFATQIPYINLNILF